MFGSDAEVDQKKFVSCELNQKRSQINLTLLQYQLQEMQIM